MTTPRITDADRAAAERWLGNQRMAAEVAPHLWDDASALSAAFAAHREAYERCRCLDGALSERDRYKAEAMAWREADRVYFGDSHSDWLLALKEARRLRVENEPARRSSGTKPDQTGTGASDLWENTTAEEENLLDAYRDAQGVNQAGFYETRDEDRRAAYRALAGYIVATRHALAAERERVARLREALEEYGMHSTGCSLCRFEGGRPTEFGGYEYQYAGTWYPADQLPPCTCGFSDALEDAK